jgi:hypothetical protein
MKSPKSLRTISALSLCGLLLIPAGLVLGADSADILKPVQVRELIKTAKSAAEHQKLAKHYEALAAKHEADAKEHEALAAEYAKSPSGQSQKHPMAGKTAEHCKYYAEHCRKAAAEMRKIASEHLAMAKAAK